jgi:hypothetical protein
VARTRLPVITTILALTAVALRAMPEVSDQLVFERGGPSLLALGRLFSCHLVHWNWAHLLWDVAVFTAVGSWCERLDRKAFAVFLGLAAIAIPPIVLAAHTELSSYAGLSGIDVGALIFAVTISLIRRLPYRRQLRMVGRDGGRCPESLEAAPPPWQAAAQLWFLGLLGAAVVAKVVYELAAGRTVMFDSTADFVPVPLAHLVGICVGMAAALATFAKNRPVRQDRTG